MQIYKKRISNSFIKEDKTMTVNGISGANNGMQAGSSGRITQMDSVSKNIQNQIANAQKKLQKKNLDFIVLNSLRNEGTCFQSDENQISIISKKGQRDYDKKSKQAVAIDIIDELAQHLN
jgi:phosphopantothenoylcysteine synthetase/decarboxylase